jgi:hypothetical protein
MILLVVLRLIDRQNGQDVGAVGFCGLRTHPALLDTHVVTGIAPGPSQNVDRRLNDSVTLFTCIRNMSGAGLAFNSEQRQPVPSAYTRIMWSRSTKLALRRLGRCHLPFGGRARRHVGAVVDGGGVCRDSASDNRRSLLARS